MYPSNDFVTIKYNPMTGRFQGMNALYYIFPLKNCSFNLDALYPSAKAPNLVTQRKVTG